jgi:DTW domain-containing protein YfiP
VSEVDGCERCGKPRPLCVCAWIEPCETRTEVLILQHPQEPDRELGSACVAALCLPRATLRVGLSWRNLGAALGRPAQQRDWVVLYLGSARPPVVPASPLIFVDRRGRPLPGPATRAPAGLAVLDGSWSQAKTLWWRNPWLLKLQRAILAPARGSLYGAARREPRREALSTIEALALALAVLEGRGEIAETLARPFAKLLEKQRYR